MGDHPLHLLLIKTSRGAWGSEESASFPHIDFLIQMQSYLRSEVNKIFVSKKEITHLKVICRNNDAATALCVCVQVHPSVLLLIKLQLIIWVKSFEYIVICLNEIGADNSRMTNLWSCMSSMSVVSQLPFIRVWTALNQSEYNTKI